MSLNLDFAQYAAKNKLAEARIRANTRHSATDKINKPT
jgi:hypothetical protein